MIGHRCSSGVPLSAWSCTALGSRLHVHDPFAVAYRRSCCLTLSSACTMPDARPARQRRTVPNHTASGNLPPARTFRLRVHSLIALAVSSMFFLACATEPDREVRDPTGDIVVQQDGALDAVVGDDLIVADVPCGVGFPLSESSWYDLACTNQNWCQRVGLCKWTIDPASSVATCVIAPEMCPRTELCAKSGACKYDPASSSCVASAETCEQCVEATCATLGNYSPVDNSCTPTIPAHCAIPCVDGGACELDSDGICRAGSELDCLASAACRYAGLCTWNPVTRGCDLDVASCNGALHCAEWGIQCRSIDAMDCNLSWTSPRHVLLPDDPTPSLPSGVRAPATCAPGHSIAHCASPVLCADQGLCGWDGLRCIPRDAHDCRMSRVCGELGWCGVVGDRCGAVLPEHCVRCGTVETNSWDRFDIVCASVGRPENGRCVPQSIGDCWYACQRHGLCKLEGAECVALNEASCSLSEDCEKYGACVVDARTRRCAIPRAKLP